MFLKSKPRLIRLEQEQLDWQLALDHLAVLEAEERFGKSLISLLSDFGGLSEALQGGSELAAVQSVDFRPFYELCYCLSARWREAHGIDMPFRQFVARLPSGADLMRIVAELLHDAMDGMRPTPAAPAMPAQSGNELAPVE